MGGGLRVGAVPTRLMGAGLASAIVLLLVGSAAAAARGGAARDRATLPALVRVAAPEPVPNGVATPVDPQPDPPKAPVPTTSEMTVAAPPAETATTVATPPPPPKPVVPQGKGMWVWKPEQSDGGNPAVMIARAKQAGLTHIFVRTGSTWDGFQNAAFLDRILPAAHEAGLKVYGWDFPKLSDVALDVFRAKQALAWTAPGGHHIDGFAADIETQSEGTQISVLAADYYGKALRIEAGPSTPLIVAVPNPTPQMQPKFPYAAVVPNFDAIAPMIYWLNREPGIDTATAMNYLKQFNKPLMPIGQAYDGAAEGGRAGSPTREELLHFMNMARDWGAVSVSFWSWQSTKPVIWDAIRDGYSFLRQPAAA